MLACSFQEKGLGSVLFALVTMHGPEVCIVAENGILECQVADIPSSMKSPMVEDAPGPPLVQKMTSSVSGLRRLSKK